MPQKRIQLLDPKVINKIAAGEVIENAASIVKELLDNALDSGATKIEVVTKFGGRHLIEVSDNGTGIPSEDLPLTILRHATSKIAQAEDLYSLATMGFRGEALATIAAVSKLVIHSAVANSLGNKIEVVDGEILEISKAARRSGTTVSVRDLFYNLPVRREFQKSLSYETQEIHKALLASFLPFPDISFQWRHDDKEIFHLTTPRDLLVSITTLLGKEFAKDLFPIEVTKGELSLYGYLSTPQASKANRTGQYLFVNKRAVNSSFISEAVRQAYGTRLNSERFPSFILFLELPPSLIDVNIHPQKKKIRFQEERKIELFFQEEVKLALEKFYTPHFPSFSYPLRPNTPSEPPEQRSFSFQPAPLLFTLPAAEPPAASFFSNFHIVAVIDLYFLLNKEGDFFLLDSRRAQHLLFYEKMARGKEEKKAIEQLLFPFIFEVNSLQKECIESEIGIFERMGISIRSLGENTFVVDAVPQGMEVKKIVSFIDLLLEEKGKKELEKRIPSLSLHLLPSRSFSLIEAQRIIEELGKCENPYLCPESRPLIIPWPKEEIQKLFK